MCRGGLSAHGRASPALNAEAFPHDSADSPTTGLGRMCTSPRPAPHHMPDPNGTRPGTADAPTTPRGRPRGAGLGPSPIPTDPPEPAPCDPMMTGPKIPRIPGLPQNLSSEKGSMPLQLRSTP